MTIIAFATSRDLDWQEIANHLKDIGYDGNLEVDSEIPSEWLLELGKDFPLQEGGSEKEIDGPIPQDILDDQSKALLEAEANAMLKNEAIDASKINIDAKNLTLDILIRRLENKGEMILDPDFQRSGNLWSNVRQSQLIESILVKLPLPAFYFDATNDNAWAVVDGLQRLSTLENFVVKKSLKLEGMEFLPGLNGKGYDDLPRPIQRRIQETGIFAYLIKPGTPDDVKYNIFKRINTGGLMLNPQEIRHALNQGVPADTIKEMAESEQFKRATTYSLDRGRRMEDRDYVNRFIAFYYHDYKTYERTDGGLDALLNKSLALIKEKDPQKLKSDFFKSMDTAYNIFMDDSFRKRFDLAAHRRRKPLNKALFEVWAVTFAQLTDTERAKLLLLRKQVNHEFVHLMNEDKYFDISITYATGDANRVRYRFGKIEELVHTILGKS